MSEPVVTRVPDAETAATIAADHVVEALSAAAAARGVAHWAVTGGSTAAGIYRLLAGPERRGAVPWEQVHLWWGDDRFVPRDHPLSNVKPVDDILLDISDLEEGTAGSERGVPIPIEQVHPFRAAEAIGRAEGAAWAAAMMDEALRAEGPARDDGWPVFDLVTLGVGPDAHLLSVFPGSEAFDSPELVLPIPAPTHVEPHVPRLTLNPAVVTSARDVLLVVLGPEKADAVASVFDDVADADPRRAPARLARRAGATWVIDEAAGARLPR